MANKSMNGKFGGRLLLLMRFLDECAFKELLNNFHSEMVQQLSATWCPLAVSKSENLRNLECLTNLDMAEIDDLFLFFINTKY